MQDRQFDIRKVEEDQIALKSEVYKVICNPL